VPASNLTLGVSEEVHRSNLRARPAMSGMSTACLSVVGGGVDVDTDKSVCATSEEQAI